MKSLEKEYREQVEQIYAPKDLIQKTKEMMKIKKENGKSRRRLRYPWLGVLVMLIISECLEK